MGDVGNLERTVLLHLCATDSDCVRYDARKNTASMSAQMTRSNHLYDSRLLSRKNKEKCTAQRIIGTGDGLTVRHS